jgi:hypothetical protein
VSIVGGLLHRQHTKAIHTGRGAVYLEYPASKLASCRVQCAGTTLHAVIWALNSEAISHIKVDRVACMKVTEESL